MNELSPNIARNIIDRIGSNGIPPEYGFQFFTAGLDPYLSIIKDEYLSSFIKQGGSTFKMITAAAGIEEIGQCQAGAAAHPLRRA